MPERMFPIMPIGNEMIFTARIAGGGDVEEAPPRAAYETIHNRPVPESAGTKQLERHRVQMKALSPVMALPTISVFISRVPS